MPLQFIQHEETRFGLGLRAHISEQTKRCLGERNILPSVIPGGCTGILQPADVSWNKPFKAHLHREYDNWMENAQKHYFSKIRKYSAVTIAVRLLLRFVIFFFKKAGVRLLLRCG